MRYHLHTLLVVLVLGPIALANSGDNKADPTGIWKWKLPNQSAENTIKLKLTGEKLSGSVFRRGNQLEVPIEDATYKAGAIKFWATVIDEHDNATRITMTFSGTLSDDIISGTVEFKRPAQTLSRDWIARRVLAESP